MTAEPTVTSVTRALTARGWIARSPGGTDGFTVGILEGGVISVQYHPGPYPIDPEVVLAAMAKYLAGEGWLVTDNGQRVLVSEGDNPRFDDAAPQADRANPGPSW